MAIDLRRPLKKFLPHLLQAKNDNLNEADTVMRVIKVFEDVLEFSAMSEITRESNIKDKYVDLAIKVDGTIKLLVEVRRPVLSCETVTSNRLNATLRKGTTAGWCSPTGPHGTSIT